EILLYRLNGCRDPPFPGTSKQYIDLYSKCWDEDPNRRPSSETVNRLLKLVTNPSTTHLSQQISSLTYLNIDLNQIGDTEATPLPYPKTYINASVTSDSQKKSATYPILEQSKVTKKQFKRKRPRYDADMDF